MDEIYIERIYHDKELVGIGLICHTREQAVKFLREVKKEITEQGDSEIIHYCEKELRIVFCRTTYAFEKRYVI